MRRNRSPYDLARMVRYATSFLAGRVLGRRALVDDPYAMLASEWLADQVGCRVVVVVRDPAAPPGGGRVRAVVRSTTGTARRRPHRWSLSRNGLSKTGYRPMDSRANLNV